MTRLDRVMIVFSIIAVIVFAFFLGRSVERANMEWQLHQKDERS